MSEEGPKTGKEELGSIRNPEDAQNRVLALAHDLNDLVRGKKDAENAAYSPTTSEDMRRAFTEEVAYLDVEIEKLRVQIEDICNAWDIDPPEEDF